MKLTVCTSCGCCFVPSKGYEKMCDECLVRPRRAKPVFCEIEESYGRCDGYFKGICEACLDFCAAEDWVGWRAVNGCEWHKMVATSTTTEEKERTPAVEGLCA